jgi:hypothetical protein
LLRVKTQVAGANHSCADYLVAAFFINARR